MSSPEQKLKRFLHYGREEPLYKPGNRLNNNIYHPKEIQSIDALIANEKFCDAAACIVKAFSDGYSAHPEMLLYALAVCAKQKENIQLTTATYKALKTVGAAPENLFLFVKFAKEFPPKNAVSGSGFRKVLRDWYLKKDPKALAELVTKRKGYHGWKHGDLMKLAHLKSDDPAMAAVIKYVLYDIATAKKEFGEVSGASDVLNYIQSIEDFKHMTDEQQAARTLESLHLTLEHIPTHLLKSREIWNALIGNLPLGILVNNLERMGYLGFLKPNSPLVARVLDALHDERLIAESHLHPAKVFIAMKKYEMSSKFMAAEKAQKKRKTENGSGEARKVVRVPPKPNMRIVAALNELFASTCKLFLAPTGMRYMVAINLKFLHFRPSDRCFRCPHVTPPEAVVVTTLCLLHADRNVAVRGPGRNDDIVPIPLTPGMTIQNGVDELKQSLRPNLSTRSDMSVARVLKWSMTKKEEYDVFVYITDHVNKADNNDIITAVNEYRKEMNLPYAKLVTLSLTCHTEPGCATSLNDPGIFDIAGFDGNVPRIIEAFSRGAF